jgi:hypothetical protein
VGVWWGFGGGLVVVFETGQEQCYLQQPKSGNSMGVRWGFGGGLVGVWWGFGDVW